MKFSLVCSTLACAALVAAQTTTTDSIPPQATAYFNANNVTTADKNNWCQAERNNCPLICGGAASVNTCTVDPLAATCTCQNGTTPDLGAFADTLPSLICLSAFGQCINANTMNLTGQEECTANKAYCGTRNATAEYLASQGGSSTSASASGSATSSASATSASASSTSSNNSALKIEVASGASLAALFAGMAYFL